jgi:RNA polymerase sigma-70 factor (ECF subfamily)
MFTQSALIAETVKLQKFSMKLTKNKSNADDLLQSTCLRALEKAHLFEDGSNLFSWTSKIMYNLFVTEYRRKVKFETQYDPESFLQKISTAPPQENNAELAKVKRAIMKLSRSKREIIMMVCVKGLRYEEVSEILQIPVGTVRSRLSRAREQLQMIMAAPALPPIQAITSVISANENMPRIPAFLAARAMQKV